jgi:hypothetical protein
MLPGVFDIPPIMTLTEFAHVMRISPRTARRWLRMGFVRAVRQGQILRVLRPDLADALQRMRIDLYVPK